MTGPIYVSGSALALAMRCAPSQVIPRVRRIGGKDRPGSALHAHMHDRNHYGVDAAMERLAARCAEHALDEVETRIVIARARAFTWSPPRGAGSEVALCLFEDGSVRRVGGGRGHYPDLPPGALVPTQVDVFWSEPQPLRPDPAGGPPTCPPGSVLWVCDYKTGSDEYPDPIERNAQVLTGALNVARWVNAELVMPGIIYFRPGNGMWDVPEHPFDTDMLATVERAARACVMTVRAQHARYAAGEPLTYTVGPHCTYCDASPHCTAKVGALKAFLDDPAPLVARGLTAEQLGRLAAMLPSIEAFSKQARAVLQEAVRDVGPIPIGDGRLWGPHPHEKSWLDPDRVVEALEPEVGREAALGAIEVRRTTSREAIEAAIKAEHERRGIVRKRAAAMRAVYGRLGENGGVRKRTETWWSAYRPRDEAPATLPGGGTASAALPPQPGEIIEGDE